MSNVKTTSKLYPMVGTAILIALIFLLLYTPIGFIDLVFIRFTLYCIPVIIGTIAFGWKYGLVLGLAFGFASLIKSRELTTASVEYVAYMNSLAIRIIVIFIPRLLIPIVTHFVNRALKNVKTKLGWVIPSVIGSLTNTVFYLGFLWLAYLILFAIRPELSAAGIGWGADSDGKTVFVQFSDLLKLFGVTAATGGVAEAIAAAIICPAILIALNKAKLIVSENIK